MLVCFCGVGGQEGGFLESAKVLEASFDVMFSFSFLHWSSIFMLACFNASWYL